MITRTELIDNEGDHWIEKQMIAVDGIVLYFVIFCDTHMPHHQGILICSSYNYLDQKEIVYISIMIGMGTTPY